MISDVFSLDTAFIALLAFWHFGEFEALLFTSERLVWGF